VDFFRQSDTLEEVQSMSQPKLITANSWRYGFAGAVFAATLISTTVTSWAQAAPPLAERLALCAGCHNLDGNSSIPENPNLAGLHADYLERQMRDLKVGKRKSATMSAIMGMVDAKEFAALASHFSEQKPKKVPRVDASTVAAGKEIYDDGITASAVPSCSGCHNEDGSGSDKYPRLAGQHSAYVVLQLLNLKSGERDNDERGVMRAVAKRMNEAQILSVAKYIATLQESEK
jgi:cytochrome c553